VKKNWVETKIKATRTVVFRIQPRVERGNMCVLHLSNYWYRKITHFSTYGNFWGCV